MNRTLAHVLLGSLFATASCRPTPEPQTGNAPTAGSAGVPSASASASASASDDADLGPKLPPLQIDELTEGSGPAAKKGDRVLVHYTGTLLDGTKFDSSLDRGTPFEFLLGGGQVIAGWELGVVGMKKGGKRRLTIPPHLAYDLQGSPPKIGPNATLKFDIELIDIL